MLERIVGKNVKILKFERVQCKMIEIPGIQSHSPLWTTALLTVVHSSQDSVLHTLVCYT